MKITGYKVESFRLRGSPYWLVKTLEGKIVAQLTISASANRSGFGSTLSSGVNVEVRGPTYFEVSDACMADKNFPYRDIYTKALVAATQAGHFKTWTRSGCGGTVARRMSEGRDIAKTQGWPALKEMLGVE